MVIFYEPVYSLLAKGNLYFRKNILTSNFTPAPFDELEARTHPRELFCVASFLVDFAKVSSFPMV